jgi:hypothetical protein
MIQERKTTSSCFVLTTISAKKQIVQASRAIIVTDMIGMRFRTGLPFSDGFETEIFPASIAELKGVLVQNCAADLTIMGLHPHNHKSEISKSETIPKCQSQKLKHF